MKRGVGGGAGEQVEEPADLPLLCAGGELVGKPGIAFYMQADEPLEEAIRLKQPPGLPIWWGIEAGDPIAFFVSQHAWLVPQARSPPHDLVGHASIRRAEQKGGGHGIRQ